MKQPTNEGGAYALQNKNQPGAGVNSLEGANCADLPGFVIDKYFNCNIRTQQFLARTALAICNNCVVREPCRDQALNMSGLQKRGVIGGVPVAEIYQARAWRFYELGLTDVPPTSDRPEWLSRPDATEIVEQGRVEDDPDEVD